MGGRAAIARPVQVAPFPRPGEPILPRLLMEVVIDRHTSLGAPGAELLQVGEIATDVWARFPRETCRRAGMAVVDRIQTRLRELPPSLLDVSLPDPATVLTFTVERRTANTLRRALATAAGAADGPWTLRRYVGLPRFGGRAVVDLLAAVEANAGRSRLSEQTAAERAFESALAVVTANLPISEQRARTLLSCDGATADRSFALSLSNGPALDLAGLARTVTRQGRQVPFRLVELGGSRIAVGPSQVTAARTAYQIASRSVRAWGTAWINPIAAQLGGAPGSGLDAELVERVLSEIETFRWVDRQNGWFLLTGGSNPLLAELTRILSTTRRLAVAELKKIVLRTRRGLKLSSDALSSIAAEIPGARLDDHELILDGLG